MVYRDLSNLVIYQHNNIVHCFEKSSMEYMKYYKIYNHPITMEEIPSNIFNNILDISNEQNINTRIKNIFNKLTNISIFLESEDFINLSSKNLDRLYYEITDFYKNNITNPHIFKSVKDFNSASYNDKMEYIVECLEFLLNVSNNNTIVDPINYYIVVAGLSIVIPKIKKLYPDIIY